MSRSTASHDVIVVGAGVVGTVCAHALAPDHDVLVLDKGTVGAGTTSRASGVITTRATYADTPIMGEHAMSFFEAFDGTGTFTFNRRSKVQLVSPDAEADARERAATGDGVDYVEPEDVERRYPGVFEDLSDYRGLLEYRDVGFIDVGDYVTSLKRVAERRGATFLTDTPVESIETDGDRVTGVETTYGTHSAPTVVCATNWRTRELLSDHVEIPVRPFRWNALILEPESEFGVGYPIGSESSMRVYWRPTLDGNLLVGGGEHAVDDPENEPPRILDSFRDTVVNDLPKLLTAARNARVVSGECCPTADTATPDTWPIVDAPAEAPAGLVVATGFQKGGVMASPIAATAVRSLVTGEATDLPMERFALDRFDSRSADFEHVSLYDSMT